MFFTFLVMGQKQSSSPNRKRKAANSKIEATEIVDLDSSEFFPSPTEQTKVISNTNKEIIAENPELTSIIGRVGELEYSINKMTDSEIDLYFATVKDSLHNYWRKVYDIKSTSDGVRNKKIEIIDKIKILLKNLDERYLKGRISY